MRSGLLLAPLLFASSAFAQDGGLPEVVELLEEAQKVLTQPGVKRVSIGDSQIADIKTIGNDQILLTGEMAGKTTLIVWLKDGQRRDVAVTVKEGEREATDVQGLELEKGQIKSFRATGVSNVALGDPAVLDARLHGGRLQLRALAPGRCDVLLLRKASPPVKLVVEVGVPDVAPAVRLTGVEIKVGQTITLAIEGAGRATTAPSAIVETKMLSPGRVSVRGVRAGQSTVDLLVGGTAMSLPVTIMP